MILTIDFLYLGIIKMSEIKKYWLILAGMLYLAYVSMMWKWGHQGDMTYWLTWSNQIYNQGFAKVYESNCNYMPAYLYFLYFHTKIQGNLTDIQDNLYTIKYYTFVFDMLGAFAAVWFVKDELKKVFYFLFLLFNVAYIYDTVMWAQVDAIYTFFGFASLIAAIERKAVISSLLLLLALNFKLQAVVFIPVVSLLLLPQLISKDGIRKIMLIIIFAITIQSLILLPFILKGTTNQVFHVITDSVGHYPYPTMCAFNMWSLLLPNVSISGMELLSDTTKFGFLSYKQIGFVCFSMTTFVAILPLMKFLFAKHVKYENILFPLQNIFLTSALVTLNFYFFNTQMHERYMHSAVILLATYAFLSKRFLPFILCSVAYFLNIERICWYLNLHNETYMNGFIFNPKLVAVMYIILISILFYYLYSDQKIKEEYMVEI